ncbi:MAG TPA: hypothetical protein VL738_34880 [Dactylosporangium sp.]|nr:hypothetical protein [Dactylosporangium sp.]
MSSTSVAPPMVRSGRVASYGTNLGTALFGAWLTAGVALDAWAHNTRSDLESFWTPWHAVLYSGFVAVAAWVLWHARGAWRTRPLDLPAIPAGYVPAVAGVVLFALCGMGDATWHTIFGIEQNINILFSPTHLGLGAAMVLILTAPVRSAAADPAVPADPGLRRLLPAVLSGAFATIVVLLLLQYANAMTMSSTDVVLGVSEAGGGGFASRLATTVVVTGLLLTVPLVAIARRWAPPFGTVTIIYTAVAAFCAAITGLEDPAMVLWLPPAGLVLDALARWVLRPAPDRPARVLAFAGIAPLVTWAAYLAVAFAAAPDFMLAPQIGGGRPEPVVEVYTGLPVVQALLGVLVAAVLAPPKPRPAPEALS